MRFALGLVVGLAFGLAAVPAFHAVRGDGTLTASEVQTEVLKHYYGKRKLDFRLALCIRRQYPTNKYRCELRSVTEYESVDDGAWWNNCDVYPGTSLRYRSGESANNFRGDGFCEVTVTVHGSRVSIDRSDVVKR